MRGALSARFYIFPMVGRALSARFYVFPMVGKTCRKVSNDWKGAEHPFQFFPMAGNVRRNFSNDWKTGADRGRGEILCLVLFLGKKIVSLGRRFVIDALKA